MHPGPGSKSSPATWCRALDSGTRDWMWHSLLGSTRVGALGIMLILHVNDLMVAGDGSPGTEAVIEKLRERFPFGEWVLVRGLAGISYTGRTITFEDDTITVQQADFVNGRMAPLKVAANRSRPDADACTAEERAEYRSCVGNLHWVTAQTRLDRAVDTSKHQKKQNAPSLGRLQGTG